MANGNSAKWQMVGALAGPVQILTLSLAMSPLLANFQPPPSPLLSAQEIADVYRANADGILTGAIVMIFSGALKLPFVAALSAEMRRMEGSYAPLSYTQLIGGALSSAPYFIGSVIMASAAFRVDRSPEVLMALNDLVWLFLMLPFGNNIMQLLPLAALTLGSKAPKPRLPRWLGYLSLLVALVFIPCVLILYHKSGPLAWDGAVPFWAGLAGHGVWTLAITFVLVKAALRTDGWSNDHGETA